MDTISSVIEESMIQYMFRVRTTGNTYDFKAILSTVCTMKIMEYYKYVHLDLDILFVKNLAFLLVKPKDIGYIHCKVILIKSYK